MKRIFLFLLTNILVIATISIITSVFGLNRFITAQGLDYTALLGFALVWGMAGSFFSLAISKWMAKTAYGVKVIDPSRATGNEAEIVEMVHALARRAGLSKMPEVGIYDSPEVNAFATGPTKNNSLVSVSTGLLQNMRRHEVEGVLAHEVAHVANGDMVTMALIQGVVNAFTIFMARIVAYAVAQAVRGNNNEGISHVVFSITAFVMDIIFSILGSIVVASFSRYREYRADAGGAKLGGRENMIAALQRLQSTMELVDTEQKAIASMKISNKGGIMALFSTHPRLEDRIKKLREGA